MSLILSNSQTQMWQHSPRCSWWRYVRGLTLSGKGLPDAPRTWGGLVHNGWENLYKGMSVAEAVDALDLTPLERLQEHGDFHTPAALRRVVEDYANTVLDKDLARFDVLTTEHDLVGPLSSTLSWMGRIDLTLREKDTGLIYVIDHKTTGKKVDSSYWTESFSHDQQMTSYWWLASREYGDNFGGILINACQTTKTIPCNLDRCPVVRDDWEIDEWYSNISSMGPRIRTAYEIGKQCVAAGLSETSAEVLAAFPINNTYSENFCDYRHLNWAPPEIREALIKSDYTTRSGRGGESED